MTRYPYVTPRPWGVTGRRMCGTVARLQARDPSTTLASFVSAGEVFGLHGQHLKACVSGFRWRGRYAYWLGDNGGISIRRQFYPRFEIIARSAIHRCFVELAYQGPTRGVTGWGWVGLDG